MLRMAETITTLRRHESTCGCSPRSWRASSRRSSSSIGAGINDVYRFAFAMAKSRSFAQDVTQEVFLNVLENASRFDSRQRLGAGVAVRLRSLRHARSVAPRAALDRRHAGRRRRRSTATSACSRTSASSVCTRQSRASRRVSRSARAVRAARVDVCRDGGGPRAAPSAPFARGCIAAARCSRRCSTKASSSTADAEPK